MELFKAANFIEMMNTKGDLAQEELILSEGVMLKELDLIYGKKTAQNLVVTHLISLSDQTNIKEEAKLNDVQLKICAINVLKSCSGITIPELAHMILQFSSGKYGKFYGQMDIMSISEWSRLYMKKRGSII